MSIHLALEEVSRKPRIVLRGWDGRTTATRCKSVPGGRAKWIQGNRQQFDFWHYPLDLTTAKLLREAFPNLEMDQALWEWGKKERAHQDFVKSLHLGQRTKPISLKYLPTDAPAIWQAMCNRGYQTVVPAFAREVGSHFNADQPGLGKTIEELGALVECRRYGKILIVAPRKALRATWGPEIHKWLSNSPVTFSVTYADADEGKGDDRETVIEQYQQLPDLRMRMDFLLINPEMLRWQFFCGGDENGEDKCTGNKRSCPYTKNHTKEPIHPALFSEWSGILVDETHKFLMNANERSGSVSQVGYGLQQLTSDYKVGMSGTPFKGKPRKFWMILHWLRPELYTGQGKWQEIYFETEDNSFAHSGKAITENLRRDREELFHEELNLIMVRRTKRELHQMNSSWAPPDKRYVTVEIGMEAKQRKAYDSMRDDALASLDSGMLLANGVLAELTRCKQLATAYGRMDRAIRPGDAATFHPALPSCKWDWIKNVFLAERGILDNDGDIKVVIASQFVAVLKMYSEALNKAKVKHFLIEGGTKDIHKIQQVWQSNQTHTRVLLLSTQAGGVSLTLDAADDLVLNDETFIPDEQEQVEDRVHRTSRTDHQVTIYRLCTLGTIDESILLNNDDLDEVQKRLLDERRGVPFAKQLLKP